LFSSSSPDSNSSLKSDSHRDFQQNQPFASISSGQVKHASHWSTISFQHKVLIHSSVQNLDQLLPSSHSSHVSIISFQHTGSQSFSTLQNAHSHMFEIVDGIITLVTFVHEKAFSHINLIYSQLFNGASLKSTTHHSVSHL
jgi:hypothetical protein